MTNTRALPEPATPDPWERQNDESDEAWEAFATYRNQGVERSIRKVGRALDKSRTLIGDWSTRHNWAARIVAYDRELDKERRAQDIAAVREMKQRHAAVAREMIAKVAAAVKAQDPAKLNAQDQARWLENAARLERLTLGEPTAIDEAHIEANITAGPAIPQDEARMRDVYKALEEAGLTPNDNPA